MQAFLSNLLKSSVLKFSPRGPKGHLAQVSRFIPLHNKGVDRLFIHKMEIPNFNQRIMSRLDLYIVGLSPISAFDERNPGPCIVSLINSIWTLLYHRQNLVDHKRDLEQKISIITNECENVKEKHSRLEKDILYSQECLSREKKMSLFIKEEKYEDTRKLKCLKQEVQEIKNKSKSREQQFKHDFRRQQIEISLLQSKLRNKKYNKEKGVNWKGPTDSSATPTVIDDSPIDRHEEICKKSISRLESNVQQLVKENLELRKLLDNVENDLTFLMSQTIMKEKEYKAEPICMS